MRNYPLQSGNAPFIYISIRHYSIVSLSFFCVLLHELYKMD